jgi:glycerol-3-phosphate dehydrogenase (NAD(P)+)
MKISVLGAGNWGTTIALLLNSKGLAVSLWEFNDTLAREMNEHRENATYLKGFPLPEKIAVTSSLSEAVEDADIVAFIVPSCAMKTTASNLRKTGALKKDAALVSFAKGLEYDTMNTMTDILSEELPDYGIAAMSGPCIAIEIAKKMPSTIVAASKDDRVAEFIQDVFMTKFFRVYTSDDPKGVQLGGALKNIIAIASGICDGLGLGANAKSALMTRGIVEMRRFGVLMGAKPETFNGLSGIGDLITTCISPHSRNRRVGEELVKGKSLDEILKEMIMVAEGVPTAKAVYEFSRIHNVGMPITGQVYGVLFEGVTPAETVSGLMMRDKKPEHDVVG